MIPTVLGVALRGVIYRFIIKSDGIFGIEENVQIAHSANLRLGKNVFIGRNSYIGASDGGIVIGNNVIILDKSYINVFNFNNESNGESKIVLNDNVVLGLGSTILGHCGVTIGKNSMFGPNTVIMTAPHGKVNKGTIYREAELVRSGRSTTIGENVLIGANVSILPGISIGDNAVIDAGSVVTRDVPPDHHFFGNPARPLKLIT